jgi:hypothetical protein
MPRIKAANFIYEYLPDWKEEERPPPREFFWRILWARAPDYADRLIRDAEANSRKVQLKPEAKPFVINAHLLNELVGE